MSEPTHRKKSIGNDDDVPEVAVVRWLDARTVKAGWERVVAAKPLAPLRCTTAGFVAAEDDASITLVRTVGEAEVEGRMTIPKGSVQWVLRLPTDRRRRGRRS
jgi:hypothetical protein